MSKLIQKIEELSVAFVMADLSDLQALADIYRKFDDLSAVARDESQDIIAKVASATSKLVEKIILDEVADKSVALDAISQTISIIQSVIVHKRNLNEFKFPDEIELPKTNTIRDDPEIKESNEINKSDNETAVSENESQSISILGDPSLITDFISESREHLHEADVKLLTLENDPKDEDALNAVYRSFHTIKGVAGFLNLDEISKLSHATEDLLDRARKDEILLKGDPIDVTFLAVDSLKQMITDIETALSSGKPLIHNLSLDEILSAIKSVTCNEDKNDEPIVKTEKASQEISEEKIKPDEEQTTQELEKETHVDKVETPVELTQSKEIEEKQPIKSSSHSIVKETLKIEAERLDKLVDMIGELVIAESMVTQDFEIISKASPRVARNLTHLNKITRELQEIGMSLRMMPVRPVFEKMARLSRDLAKKAGKKIEFSMSGEDTEVDKSVVEKISDPLTHMIRNAVDHGIEATAEERTQIGKSDVGHIKLRAFHKSGDIIIEVEDDGKGLDKEAILNKAKEKGLISDSQSMFEHEIFNLIFMPGFSTAKVVTDVSGRGVGMDVVNRNIQALRGQIDIRSTNGKGTVFSLRLPLTLAIMDGIIVQVGSEQYIIPTLSVVESIRPRAEELSTIMENAEMLSIRGKFIPMFRVSSLFQVNDAIQDPTEALIVVVEEEGKQVGFMVDSLVGHQQIVIKSLGDSFDNIKGISGGAIMSDGQVGLILDVTGIVKLAVSGTAACIRAA